MIHDLTAIAPRASERRRAVAELEQHRAMQARDRLAAGGLWVNQDLVFATEIGTPLDPSNLRRTMDRFTTKAGIGRWTPYELRHSAASLLCAAGVPIDEVADVLGHVDTRMLMKHYRHRVTPTIASAVAPMEAMFGAGAMAPR